VLVLRFALRFSSFQEMFVSISVSVSIRVSCFVSFRFERMLFQFLVVFRFVFLVEFRISCNGRCAVYVAESMGINPCGTVHVAQHRVSVLFNECDAIHARAAATPASGWDVLAVEVWWDNTADGMR